MNNLDSKLVFAGTSNEINGLQCTAGWKDVFVFNDHNGIAHVVSRANVILSEMKKGERISRTAVGNFKPNTLVLTGQASDIFANFIT